MVMCEHENTSWHLPSTGMQRYDSMSGPEPKESYPVNGSMQSDSMDPTRSRRPVRMR